jgi:Arc/MetJ family transcription regulator
LQNNPVTVDIDQELIDRACALTGIKTTREVIHEALRVLIQLRQQEEVRSLRSKLRWEGDLEQTRTGRFPHN